VLEQPALPVELNATLEPAADFEPTSAPIRRQQTLFDAGSSKARKMRIAHTRLRGVPRLSMENNISDRHVGWIVARASGLPWPA
jgi:hypothetical protein